MSTATATRSAQARLIAHVLDGGPQAAAAARELAQQVVRPGGQADAVITCTSELVTNAIRYSRSGRPGGRVTLTVRHLPRGRVLVEVADEGGAGPGCGVVPADEHGRGLNIVAVLAEDWGVKPVFAGRLTWCRVAPVCRRP